MSECTHAECREQARFQDGAAFGLSFAASLIEANGRVRAAGLSCPVIPSPDIAHLRDMARSYATATRCLAPGYLDHPRAEEAS